MATPDGGRDSTDELLWMIRAGMVDAEIAVRLGISTAEVKQRVERLAKRLNVDGREGLRASSLTVAEVSRERPRPLRFGRRLGPYVAVGVVCAVLGAVSALGIDSAGAPSASESPPATTSSATPAPSEAAVSRPTVMIDGTPMVDAGRFVYSKRTQAPVFEVSERAGFVVLSLQPGAYLTGDENIRWVPTSGSGGFQVEVGGQTLNLGFSAANDSTGFQETSTEVAVFTRDDAVPAELVLWTYGRDGVTHSVHVDLAGELFISTEPIAPEIAIETSTGEALDLGAAASAGQLDPAARPRPTNWCVQFPACISTFDYPTDLAAPVAGEVVCPDRTFDATRFAPGPPRVVERQGLSLRGPGYTLHFLRRAYSVSGIPPGDLPCPAATRVEAGDRLLGPGSYTLIASGSDDEPMDVAIDGNLTIHVGPITPKFGCPCLGGD